jgi:hypothetical protein
MTVCLIAFAACDDNDFTSSNPTGPSFTGRLSGPPVIGNLSTGAVISGRVSGITANLTTDQTSGVNQRSDRTTRRHRPTGYFNGGWP